MNQNGRVHIMDEGNKNPFELYDKIPITDKLSNYHDALTGNWSDSPLSLAFFSKENQIILQNGIRSLVYKQTNGVHTIPEQNPDTLRIIMRSIFLEHSVNLPYDIKNQIVELNNLIYKYAVPQIVNEIESYMKYKNDVSYLPIPMSRPSLANTKNRTLELKPFF
jgi:hypothetical protein